MPAVFEKYCKKCGMGFVDLIALSRHMLEVHAK